MSSLALLSGIAVLALASRPARWTVVKRPHRFAPIVSEWDNLNPAQGRRLLWHAACPRDLWLLYASHARTQEKFLTTDNRFVISAPQQMTSSEQNCLRNVFWPRPAIRLRAQTVDAPFNCVELAPPSRLGHSDAGRFPDFYICSAFFVSPDFRPMGLSAQTKVARWLVRGWLAQRLTHKLEELRLEFRPRDARSNQYHLNDCSDIARDLWRAFQLLKKLDRKNPQFRVALQRAAALHGHLQTGLEQPWVCSLRGEQFVTEMQRLLQQIHQCAQCRKQPKQNHPFCNKCNIAYVTEPRN